MKENYCKVIHLCAASRFSFCQYCKSDENGHCEYFKYCQTSSLKICMCEEAINNTEK
jgi:hypothetical protein